MSEKFESTMSQPDISFYDFDEFRVDVQNRILMRNDRVVRVTERPFEVLMFLIENRSRVVGKEELMERFWPSPNADTSNVDQQINVLRDILSGKFHRQKHIKTIRGQGFRFVAEVKEKSNGSQPTDRVISHPSGFGLQWKQVLITAALAVLVCTIAAIFYFRGSDLKTENSIAPLVKGDEKDPAATWTAIVPPIAKGVPLKYDGHPFELIVGDEIEVVATGIVDIGRGPVGPEGEVGDPPYRDSTADSEFKDRIGGLEMWIGPDKEANRYFIGPHFTGTVRDAGMPTFRVIESLPGYNDGNSGAFVVTVRRLPRNQNKTQ